MGGLMAREPEGEKREQMEPGNYQAVCFQYHDLGTHHVDYFYEGKHIVGDYHKVRITWEFPDERMEITKDGVTIDMPRVLGKEYTLTLGKKANLRKDLESWRGRDFTEKELEGFSLDKILGVNAMLTVIHNDKGYATIATVNPLMKNMEKKKAENEVYGWSFTNDGPEQLSENTPEWIKDKIMASLEWQSYSEKPTGKYEPNNEPKQEPDQYIPKDDIPF